MVGPMQSTTPTLKPNRYPGTCAACGGPVPAGAGFVRRVNGRWIVGHAPCPGMVEPMTRPVLHSTYRYAGMTWPQVDEANEFFDGEVEIRAAARAEWERRSGMFCPRHGDSFAPGDASCWECRMEADERRRDIEDGRYRG